MGSPADETEPIEQQLERLLADAEASVAQLRRDLDDARNRRAHQSELQAQHEEIDRLRDHLAQAEVHWDEVRKFFETALRPFLDSRGSNDSSDGTIR